MMQFVTPVTILQSQTEVLLNHLPSVRDGDVDGVHDARVATRRIRAVLPLTHEWHRRSSDDLPDCFKRIGRALGKVRDADVRLGLLSYVETHVPSSASSIAVLRHERERKRLRAMRKLIKRFERLSVERMLHDVGRRSARSFQPWTTVAGSWRRELAHMVAERACAARESIERMTGVYFPNRAHTARIGLKKFRYALEIAAQTGIGTVDGSLRDLKKGQDILGDLHDRQVLIDALPGMATPDRADISRDHICAIVDALEVECRELHRQYLSRRGRLLEICEQSECTSASSRAAAVATVTAGVVALSSAAYTLRRFAPARPRRAESVPRQLSAARAHRVVG